MQKLKMLVLWKNRRPRGEATTQHLLSSLEDLKDLLCEGCNLDTKKYQLISEPERDISPKEMGARKRKQKTKALSDKQLLQVAESLGQEWEQAAIYLKLSITDLDNIKAERQTSVSMQKLKMLVLWKKQRP
ncbi:hypothetical protein NHX12_008822 [Muraenolepis orangiensis]|uniref:Death domain-containing protein n=1 Tax=Muraenolepis orangiensis TaxID=630683 RepID=A0A9Q0I9Q3_9TELE|nr:hypothetical protein NHX12_008822 [Muraenolepis orangiensis]